MPGKMSDPGTVPEKIMKFEGNAGEDEESGHDAGKDNELQESSGEVSKQSPKKVGFR